MHVLSADASLVPVFAHRGPFVCVYLDATHGPFDGPDVIDHRWAAVRETLDSADPDSLDAIEESLTAGVADTGAHGLVAVAAEGELCLSARLATPPEQSAGFHTPLPLLLPYLSVRPPPLPNVVVVATPDGGAVLTYAAGDLRPVPTARPADDVDGVLRAVVRLASQTDPDLVVVAGDAGARERVGAGLLDLLVREVLVRVVDVAADDVAGLRSAAEDALRDRHRADEHALLGGMSSSAGDRNRVVTGLRDVAAALRMAQVEAVVLSAGAELDQRCWVGPRPTEFGLRDSEAALVGLRSVRHDRAASAVIRAAFATGARLTIAGPYDWSPPGGVAALLR